MDHIDTIVQVAWYHSAIIIFSAIKLIGYLRIFESIGLNINLIMQAIKDTGPFLFFFVSWIACFCLLMLIAGWELDVQDYPGVNYYVAYIIQTYRNSIGDITPPSYSFWIAKQLDVPLIANGMIFLIWAFWFFQ